MEPHYRISLLLFIQALCIILLAESVSALSSTGSSRRPCKSGSENSTDYVTTRPTPIFEPDLEFLDLKNESIIDWEDGFKNCGAPMEGCDTSQNDSRNYMDNPSFCRCDKECIKYGDCCVTVLKEIKKVPKEPYWRCVHLPNSKYAVRMISKCPSSYPNNWLKQLCEQPENCWRIPKVNVSQHCPLLDVPVIDYENLDLYRSSFCARCHSIPNKKWYRISQQYLCSESFKQDPNWKWEEFRHRAIYLQGKLEWVDPVDPSSSCTRDIREFQPYDISQLLPNVRFCPGTAEENCAVELGQEDQLVLHNLCVSYMQVVFVPAEEGATNEFKNPHCAKCSYPNITLKGTPKCHRLRDRYLPEVANTLQNREDSKLFDMNIEELDDQCEEEIQEEEEEDGKITNSNFSILITLLSLSILLLFSFLIAVYLILPKGCCKETKSIFVPSKSFA